MALILFIILSVMLQGCSEKTPVTIYLAGDSTMAEKQPDKRPETGWGEALQAFFDDSAVRVENHARNGRSTRSFVDEGRWQAIVDTLREGDYVFIQFGHNDQKVNTDRYASPNQYAENLAAFVRDVRAKGANPVLLTPVVRRRFDGQGTFYDTHGDYPAAVHRVAAEQEVPLIDMHQMSTALLQEYGEEQSKELFLHLKQGEHPNYPDGLEDDTHFSPGGALMMAEMAVAGVHQLNLGLADFLR